MLVIPAKAGIQDYVHKTRFWVPGQARNDTKK